MDSLKDSKNKKFFHKRQRHKKSTNNQTSNVPGRANLNLNRQSQSNISINGEFSGNYRAVYYQQQAGNPSPLMINSRCNEYRVHKNTTAKQNEKHSKLEELFAKNPEDIILMFRNPGFRFEEYLNAPMKDALIFKLMSVLNRAFECNSIETLMRSHIIKIVESDFFKTHLYDQLNRKTHFATNSYNTELIELTLKLCCRFLILLPQCHSSLSAIIDRLELIVMFRLNDPGLKELFSHLLKIGQEASFR